MYVVYVYNDEFIIQLMVKFESALAAEELRIHIIPQPPHI